MLGSVDFRGSQMRGRDPWLIPMCELKVKHKTKAPGSDSDCLMI